MKRRLPTFTLILFCFAVFGACTVQPEHKAAPAATSVASIEAFLPESVRNIFKRSCESCHGYDGRGISGVAPDILRSFGHKAEEWEHYFQSIHPGAQMPSTVWMSQDEIKTAAAFLASLPNPNDRVIAPDAR